MHDRFFNAILAGRVTKGFVEVLFGARQTGKTTLLRQSIKPNLIYDLSDPIERHRLLADPGIFRRECEALPVNTTIPIVWVDEVQAVPAIFDLIQSMYDKQPQRWKFLLSGSCARRLRGASVNLLPGRAILHQLHPLVLWERPATNDSSPAESLILPSPLPPLTNPFPAASLESRLAFGDLPGVAVLDDPAEKTMILKAYSAIHLQEEIRREALVQNWGHFTNFLRLAALESGNILNYSALAREIGISVPTIKSHFGLLKEMFIGFEVPAFSGSPRKNLLSTPRFLFSDLGIRHAAAGLDPAAGISQPGHIFEQWVGCELHKRLGCLNRGSLSYFRTKSGAEIDFIIELDDRLIPIEVKWTDHPTIHDARHLRDFLHDHPRASHAYVVCRCPRPAALADRITAIPWFML